MADTKLTALPDLGEPPANDDFLYVVDTSDTTDDAAGSSKKVAATHFVRGTTSGFSVLGKSTTGTGAPASITASANQVLRRSGSGNLVFGTLVAANIGDSQITTAKVADNAVTFAKMQTLSGIGAIGVPTPGGGTMQFMSATANNSVFRRAGSGDLGFGTLVTGNLGDGIVTNAKLANMAQATIKGRAAGAGTGAPVDLTQLQVQQVVLNLARQGGNASNWSTPGTSTQTMVNARIQCGAIAVVTGNNTITFPAAFGNAPIVFAQYASTNTISPAVTATTASQFTLAANIDTTIYWFAIGAA